MSDVVVTPVPEHRPRKRRAAVTATVLVVLVGGGAAAWVERGKIEGLWQHNDPPASGVSDNSTTVATATVSRQTLTAQQQVNGTLGYIGSYTIVGHGGTLTGIPTVGEIVREGGTLYWADGNPVVLLFGSVPMYRDLTENLTGADVQELNAALVALGYATRSQLNPSSDTFSAATKAAVERLQKAMGVTQDGTLHQNQAVFLPGAVRITTVSGTLGGPAGGTIASGTSTNRQVVVELDATQQSQVKVGDQVAITLPNGQTTPGTVAKVGTVAVTPSGNNNPGASNTPQVEVDITPTDSAATGTLDQAPVQVEITTNNVPNALVVPVNALLALANGGYAVEVVQPNGQHKLVAVTVGMFDDGQGLVQVSDTTLQPGDKVVVAGT